MSCVHLTLMVAVAALSVFTLSCTGKPPIQDYNLAYVAVEAAKGSQAAKYAPALWTLAERSYQEGQEFFRRERYREAEKAFVRARGYAEKAENISRLRRYETGDGVL